MSDDAMADHKRMCEAFDEWSQDDSTHWISEQDAAYQGFMAAWELRSSEQPCAPDDQWPRMQVAKLKRQRAALRETERLAKRLAKAKGRYHNQHAMCDLLEHFGMPCVRPGEDADETVSVPRALLEELASDLEAELKHQHIDYPVTNRRLEVDMGVVRRAREILGGSDE
ncbi:MAG: hypothetical protein GYB17_03900 [Gammaproteobacteria bacterium]|nr:hypothetical protein [Gammaproteobacteria bacterium]